MHKSMIKAALLTSMFTLPAAADIADQTNVKAAIKMANAWVEKQLQYNGIPGGSVAVVKDQDIVWSKGFGYASIKNGVKATADTQYSICSVSKLFTAIGVLQQRDAGKLSLDASIGDILPWYDLPAHPDAEEPVTLRNILSHVSGLPREAVSPYWVEEKFPTQAQIRSGLKNQQAYYVPYKYFQYSNLGLTLAGEAVAAASGTDYHTYIQENILDPLGMDSTTTELPVQDYGGKFSAGYRLRGADGTRAEVEPYTTNGIAPAAGFASSVNDLAKFASWQFRLRKNGETEVLKATTLREMQRVHWTDPDGKSATWGLGFAMNKVDGKTFIGHGGYCPGYRTSFLTRPDDKLAVIAIVNVNDMNPHDISKGVAGLMGPAVKKAKTDDEVEPSKFAKYEGTFGRKNMPNDSLVVATEDGLNILGLYSDNPGRAITRLVEGKEEHTFRVKSRDGKKLDTVRFEMDSDGKPVKMWRHGQYAVRLD